MKTLLKTAALGAVSTLTMATAALADGVRTERVSFLSNGERVVGTLYIPEGVNRRNPAPGVVLTGAWMTIKEQMAGRYARELAERGIVALAFDFRTWGESGGRQRSMESPAMKTADIVAAARFLDARAETAPFSIGALGVCASAGYAVHAAAQSNTIRAVGLVAPWLHDAAIVQAVYGANIGPLTAAAQEAQARYDATSELTLLPAAGPAGSNAVMAFEGYYTDPARGAVSQWENTFNVASWDDWLSFDALSAAPRLTKPLFVVHSDAAAIPQGARQFLAATQGPSGSLWLDNVGQFDFYDQAAPVKQAADAVAAHFHATL
jgi:dienelactone hydrolase